MSFEDYSDEYFPKGPGHPSSCHRPVWPFKPALGHWGFPPRNPVRDVTFFREAIEDIIKHMIRRGELLPGPSAPGQVKPLPLIGVTDGSDAAVGIVGEFVMSTNTFNYAAFPQTTSLVLSVVIPPGDWDIRASMTFSTAIGGANVFVTPKPPGLSNNMGSGMLTFSPSAQIGEVATLFGMARGSFLVPALLPFQVNVLQGGDSALVAGAGTMYTEARRMR